MAKISEKNYMHNPYVYDMVNVIYRFCRDGSEAERILKKNPKDVRSTMVREYCYEFRRWMSEKFEMSFGPLGALIMRILEDECDEK